MVKADERKAAYLEKLRSPLWQKKKTEIQQRDNFTCQKCGNTTKNLQVHHRHYIFGRDPWDYPDQLLILLCEDCHKAEEGAKTVLKDLLPSLHYWGYFDTEIVDVVNKLIESKIPSKNNG